MREEEAKTNVMEHQTTDFSQRAPIAPIAPGARIPPPAPVPPVIAAPTSPSPQVDALEALAWCQEHEARVFWFRAADDGQPRCSVEVLAPGSSWNLLRGRGADFMSAYSAVRGKWSTNGARSAA